MSDDEICYAIVRTVAGVHEAKTAMRRVELAGTVAGYAMALKDRIAAAKAQGAAEERAAIVEWLQSEAAKWNQMRARHPEMIGQWSVMHNAARIVEAGDHIKQEAKPNE